MRAHVFYIKGFVVGKYIQYINDGMIFFDKKQYYRPQYQSYMTAPEWRNVEISEDLAHFLREGNSLFHFPYFTQVIEIWTVLYRSYSASRKHDSAYDIIFSEYMVMDLFVAMFTTSELLPKAFVSFMLYPFLNKKNHTKMQGHLADYFAFYAKDIETKPFFDHDFKTHRADLAKKYAACTDKTWVDWFSWSSVSMELWTKQWLSKAMHTWFHQEKNIAPSTTDILVKFDAQSIDDPAIARALFKAKLTDATKQFRSGLDTIKEEDDIHLVDEHLYVKEQQNDKNHLSVYARLTAPRFMDFRKSVHALANQGIYIRKIAGQDNIQVKCELNAHDVASLNVSNETIKQTQHATQLYTYQDGIHINRRFCLFDVPVKNMHITLDALEAPLNDATSHIKFVHNF